MVVIVRWRIQARVIAARFARGRDATLVAVPLPGLLLDVAPVFVGATGMRERGRRDSRENGDQRRGDEAVSVSGHGFFDLVSRIR